jgi:uncharacterized MAPEG superfamily protein
MKDNKKKARVMIIAYPFGVLFVAAGINLFVFDVGPLRIAIPTPDLIVPMVIAVCLLLINHIWLMTTTELTRLRFNLHATPEEWAASGTNKEGASQQGLQELERRHNAHRNTTENTIYFVLLSFIFVLVSPTILASQIWIIGFGAARLGYSYSYLTGSDNMRGLFMTLSLLSMYGMGSYLVICLIM